MRAIAVKPGRREVALIEQPGPSLSHPGDVMLRMLEVGVCGTDKEICAFEYGTPPEGGEHLVIGHESVAEVVTVADGVTRVRPGDLVVPMVRRPCPHAHCAPCRAGRQDFCTTGDFRERGIKQAHGFMTELVVDHERYMNVVPKALREVAVLVEPLTIAEKALIQLWKLQERLTWTCPHAESAGSGHCHRALVLGAGPVGLLGAMALGASGFETSVYSRESETDPKADLVRSFGGRYLSAVDRPLATLGEFDIIYEAVGSSRLAFEAMGSLGANGVFVFTGVPGLKGPSALDTDKLMRAFVLRNQVALGTVNAGQDAFEAAIRDLSHFLERWPAAVRALITGRYPMDAYRDLLLGRGAGIKNVIAIDGRAS